MSKELHRQFPESNGGGPSVTDLVEERLRDAHRKLERRDGATRPQIGRRAKGPPATPRVDQDNAAPSREVRALQSVYHDFGKLHRQYRARTGERTSPQLRAAALAFKQAPSLLALVAVAGFLHDLGLLES